MALRFLGHRTLATSVGKSQVQGSGLRFSMTLGVEERLCAIHVMHTGVKRERKKGRKGGWKGMEKVSEPAMQRAVGR